MKNQFGYLTSLLVVLFITGGFSQNHQWIVFDTTNSGFPCSVANCIAIDNSNTKWIGLAERGLVTFNGNHWAVYDTSNTPLPENYVGCIAVDNSNNIWMGSSNRANGFGLVKFDGTSWNVYDTTNSGLPSNQTHWIVIDELNNKWIGTDEGLAKFDGADWVFYNQSNSGLPSNWVWRFAIDEANNKWFCNDPQSLVKLHSNDTTWTTFTNLDTLLAARVDDIAIDTSNNIWTLGRQSNSDFIRLIKFDGTNWAVYYDDSASVQSFSPFSMTIDESSNIWIATRYNGIKKFDGTNWTTYDESNSGIFSNHCHCITIDDYGNKWIGTGYGISVYNEAGVVSVETSETISTRFYLEQNYPNPFNPITNIEFSIQKTEFVTLKIHNILGQEVATLVSDILKSGTYQFTWDAGSLASGVYFYHLQVGKNVETRKMILMK